MSLFVNIANLVEDEIHFLLVCPVYKEVHKTFGILEFENFEKNKNIKNPIDPQTFKDSKALNQINSNNFIYLKIKTKDYHQYRTCHIT